VIRQALAWEVLVLIALTAGCGGSEDRSAVDSNAPVSGPTPGTPEDRPVTVGAPTSSLATPEETPSAAASTLDFTSAFEAWVGGGDPQNTCGWVAAVGESWPPPKPTFGFGFDLETMATPQLTIPDLHEMCIVGFDLSRPMTLTLEADEWTKTVRVTPGAASDVTINGLFDPEGPSVAMLERVGHTGAGDDYLVTRLTRLDQPSAAGSYVLTVAQGDDVATRQVEVATRPDPGDPSLRVITAHDHDAWNLAHVGGTLRLVLSGFPPNSSIPLALYRGTNSSRDGAVGPEFEFVAVLEPAAVGDQGWGYHDVVVPDLAPVPEVIWDYCFVTVASLREPYCQPYVDAVFDLGP
jgi:hypothetical protein